MMSSAARLVAVVEDEDTLREMVCVALGREGYRTENYGDGAQAWNAFAQQLPDLVVLDIGLPQVDGLELCRRLRARSAALPIIFVTSREEEFDRVLGLEIGADDYLCKPFSMRELMARVKVLFRRAALAGVRPDSNSISDPERVSKAGSLTLDLRRYTATWKDKPLAVTVTEFLLLQALAKHPGHVKTRDQLMAQAYP